MKVREALERLAERELAGEDVFFAVGDLVTAFGPENVQLLHAFYLVTSHRLKMTAAVDQLGDVSVARFDHE